MRSTTKNKISHLFEIGLLALAIGLALAAGSDFDTLGTVSGIFHVSRDMVLVGILLLSMLMLVLIAAFTDHTTVSLCALFFLWALMMITCAVVLAARLAT